MDMVQACPINYVVLMYYFYKGDEINPVEMNESCSSIRYEWILIQHSIWRLVLPSASAKLFAVVPWRFPYDQLMLAGPRIAAIKTYIGFWLDRQFTDRSIARETIRRNGTSIGTLQKRTIQHA